MRTYRRVTPPKDWDPRLVNTVKTIDDFLVQLQDSVSALARGERPDQSREVIVEEPGVIDHGALSGLVPVLNPDGSVQDYNDDHTQYALLDGRPEGQYLYGSRAADVAGWSTRGTFTLHSNNVDSVGLAYSGMTVDNHAPTGTGIFLVLGTSFFDAGSGGAVGETNYHTTFTDTAGNTWTKLKESSAYAGASTWRTCSLWYTLVSSAITAGTTTLGCTFTTPNSAEMSRMALESYSFNLGAGTTINVVDSTISDQGPSTEAQPDALTLTASGETLYFRGIALHPFNSGPGFTGFTPTGGFTPLTTDHTDSTVGGAPSDTGFGARGEFRVLDEGVTSTPTVTVDPGGYTIANLLVAIQIQPGAAGLLNLSAANLASIANIELVGETINVNADFFNWRAPGSDTTLSYIDGSDGSFHGSVVLDPLVHLLNTDLFDDVTAGTPAAQYELIMSNASSKWTRLAAPTTAVNTVFHAPLGVAAWHSDLVLGGQIRHADTSGLNYVQLTSGGILGGGQINIGGDGASGDIPSLGIDDGTTTLGIAPVAGTMFFDVGGGGNFSVNTGGSTQFTITAGGVISAFPTMGVSLNMGGFDITALDDITLNADGGSNIGTSTVGLNQAHFAQNSSAGTGASLASSGRGLLWIDATEGDFFIGSDNLFGNFYGQRTVKAGSTVLDTSEDATNFYQGAWGSGATPSYPFIEMNYQCGDGSVGKYIFMGEDDTTYIRDGSVLIGTNYTSVNPRGGGGLVLGSRREGCGVYYGFDETNARHVIRLMSVSSKAASQLNTIAFAGTRLARVEPMTDNAVDLGRLTTNRFKSIFLSGDIDHDGANIGFYAVTPVARPAAYTQTYSTATRTHSALTSATLTDSSGGTANTTVQALTDPADTPADADTLRDDLVANLIPELRNNFADLTAQINALRVDIENIKQIGNQVIDDLQAVGLLQ